MSSPFQVDSLIHHLKELQNEKTCLENKLGELRLKHQLLEAKNDGFNMKLLQVKETHHKMEETLKVALLKVSQTQSHADGLEKSNEELRTSIAIMENSIDSEKVIHDTNIRNFEQSLSSVADNLNRARLFYSDTNLLKECTTVDMMEVNLKAEFDTENEEIEGMVMQLDSLKLSKQKLASEDELTEKERIDIWSMVTECLDTLSSKVMVVQETLQEHRIQENHLIERINDLTAT